MPLPIDMDVHIPLVITEGLRRKGIDVLTSQEDGTSEMDDEALLDRATALGRFLFTQDQDFLRIASDRHGSGIPFLGIVVAHQQGASLGRIIDDIELIASCGELAEFSNQVTYLPLRA
jgi:predicted nuclease of predicted toxin-antitoxin system